MALEFEDITGKIIGASHQRRHGLIVNFASRTPLAKRVSVEVGEPRSPAFLPS